MTIYRSSMTYKCNNPSMLLKSKDLVSPFQSQPHGRHRGQCCDRSCAYRTNTGLISHVKRAMPKLSFTKYKACLNYSMVLVSFPKGFVLAHRREVRLRIRSNLTERLLYKIYLFCVVAIVLIRLWFCGL